ncbi:hypothetical protein JL100_021780 [Skermanella mucosa]|uniref:hypothetical protein n=1 Tax=Skermanella mucosa TaxID=1789672 RepID=UPI00192AEC30|nr:hypothetical protein [Skermanella mucosa]UEM19697.1 hypothetical protein JL100_021780 [Skermanella mucosa]
MTVPVRATGFFVFPICPSATNGAAAFRVPQAISEFQWARPSDASFQTGPEDSDGVSRPDPDASKKEQAV